MITKSNTDIEVNIRNERALESETETSQSPKRFFWKMVDATKPINLKRAKTNVKLLRSKKKKEKTSQPWEKAEEEKNKEKAKQKKKE